MAGTYPVFFDIERPVRLERAHVFLRIAILVLASALVGSFGSPFGLLYLALPVLAAILIAQKDGARFLEEDGPGLTRALRWIVAVLAYLAMLTDRLPGAGAETVRFEVDRSGSPTVGSALLRILYALPSAIVLLLLGFVSGLVWIVASVFVLARESYPAGLFDFQRGVVRWEARILAYLASLVEAYPPFSLDMGAAPPAGSRGAALGL